MENPFTTDETTERIKNFFATHDADKINTLAAMQNDAQAVDERLARDQEDFNTFDNTLKQIQGRLPEHQAIALEMMPLFGTFGLLFLSVFCCGFWTSCCCGAEMCDRVHKPLWRCCSRSACWPWRCGRGIFRKGRAFVKRIVSTRVDQEKIKQKEQQTHAKKVE